jgi:hypothetical protein
MAQAGADTSSQAAAAVKAKDIEVSMTQDLRFAVAMSGGVSLAVWMGGVAREMNLLQQASNSRMNENAGEPLAQLPGTDRAASPGGGPAGARGPTWDAQPRDLYLKLLGLLDVKVTVDVLSGTSAGGINAALLGLSSAAGVDPARLRDLWLTTGSMDALLRDPGEKNPPSLMQGDKVLFNGLNQGIKALYDSGRNDPRMAPREPVDTTVFITTTMMPGRRAGSPTTTGPWFPRRPSRAVHLRPGRAGAQDWHAVADRPGAGGAQQRTLPGGVRAVVRADQLPDRRDEGHSRAPGHGGLREHDPKPLGGRRGPARQPAIDPLLAQVFSQPARGQVRRVLAFVVPDGGGTPSPAAQPAPDKWAQPPTMAGALKKDLGAQQAQLIATDLQAVRATTSGLRPATTGAAIWRRWDHGCPATAAW